MFALGVGRIEDVAHAERRGSELINLLFLGCFLTIWAGLYV